MGHWGTCPHSSFGNSVHPAAAANLTVKISKINKEKHVLNFHLSRQKHANAHVNRLKQPLNQKEIPGRGGEEKVHAVPPLTSYPGDATDSSNRSISFIPPSPSPGQSWTSW